MVRFWTPILLACTFLCSCASGPKFKPLEAPSNNQALVYVYRPAKFKNAGATSALLLDGEERANIPNGGYTGAFLAPGDISIGIGFGKNNAVENTRYHRLQGGETYYFRVDSRIFSDTRYRYFQFWVDLVSNSTGAEEIIKTRFVGSLSSN